MSTSDDPAACAARGAALLDRIWPDWFNAIDQIHLDMAVCDQCVLGQIYRDYEYGLHALEQEFERDGDAYYGFYADESWDALTDAWRAEVARRKGGTSSPVPGPA